MASRKKGVEPPTKPIVIVTMNQVTETLKVSRPTVYRWIYSGELPVYRAGKRSIRFLQDDVEAMLRRISSEGFAHGEAS